MINRILGFTKISRSGRLHNVTEVMSPITPKVFDLIFLLADPLCLLESCYSRCSVLLQEAPKLLEASQCVGCVR